MGGESNLSHSTSNTPGPLPKVDSILRELVTETWSLTGIELFNTLVDACARKLQVDLAFVGEFRGKDKICSLALVHNGVSGQMSYPLSGSPCETVVEREPKIITEDVAKLFPNYPLLVECGFRSYAGSALFSSAGERIGIIVFASKNPMQDIAAVRAVLEFCTPRAAAELERLLSQAALARNEQQLQTALNAANMGMWDWDMLTNKISWTEGVERIFGLDPGTYDGSFKTFSSLIHPEDIHLMDEAIQTCLATGNPFTVEHRIVWRNGTQRWVRGQGNAFRNEAGQPVRMMGICQDITERKQTLNDLEAAVSKAEAANRVKNAILANMSHEIRTPMTAILGFAELLQSSLDGHPGQDYALTITQGGKRLLHLLDSIVDMARLEADSLQLVNERHRLVETLERVHALMAILASRKGVVLDLNVDPDLVVDTDPRREEQIFTNIVSNAIRFTDKGEVVIEAFASNDGHAVIQVRDTGIGISPAFLPHIFEEFRQESEGIARAYQGSGLGLAIAKKLVEKMNGRIAVASNKGEGTAVTVAFPLAEPSPDGFQRAAEPERGEPSNWRKAHVLVVEDDPDTVTLISEALSPFHAVRTCSDVKTAVEMVAVYPFTIVLLDINLGAGGAGGIDALHAMRTLPGRESLPIIALTAYAMKGDRERFLAEGFDYYLAKPFATLDLLSLIERLTSFPVNI